MPRRVGWATTTIAGRVRPGDVNGQSTVLNNGEWAVYMYCNGQNDEHLETLAEQGVAAEVTAYRD